MASPADLDQTLRTICVLALKLLPGAELAAVTRPGAPPVGTSELAEHLAAHPEEVAAGHHVLTEPLPGADGELLLFTTSPHGFQDIDPAVLEMCATAAGAVATRRDRAGEGHPHGDAPDRSRRGVPHAGGEVPSSEQEAPPGGGGIRDERLPPMSTACRVRFLSREPSPQVRGVAENLDFLT